MRRENPTRRGRPRPPAYRLRAPKPRHTTSSRFFRRQEMAASNCIDISTSAAPIPGHHPVYNHVKRTKIGTNSHTLSPLRRAQMKCMGGFDDFRKQKLFFLPRRSPLLQVRNSLSSRQDKKRHGISSNLYIFALFSHPDDSSQCRPAGSTGVSKACLRIEKGGGGAKTTKHNRATYG